MALPEPRSGPLTTHFVTVQISLDAVGAEGVTGIEAALRDWGEPLRWAITQIDATAGTATVEAVVTRA